MRTRYAGIIELLLKHPFYTSAAAALVAMLIAYGYISGRERELAQRYAIASAAAAREEIRSLSAIVPAGHRAASVVVDRSTGVARLIRPNDSVDVYVTLDLGGDASSKLMTFGIVKDAKVLAVGDELSNESLKDAAKPGGLFGRSGGMMPPGRDDLAVTLALSPDDAQLLALAKEAGRISLALRPLDDGDEFEYAPAGVGAITGNIDEIQPGKKKFREYRGR